ncbi:MAG: tRNA dihydrouridine synthase [Planctomycetota bacterium]
MAGFTNHAYRQIVRRFGGAGLLTTEMVSARGFLEIDARSHRLPGRLWAVEEEPRPLAVQIWDNDPQVLAAIGRRLAHELRVSVVDVNFGCPVRQVSQKAQSGSYLLRRPDRVRAIVARVVEACAPVPVTAKIVTVHGRTAAEKYRGSADWQRIAEIKPHLRRIPLIGNGDLKTPQSVVEAFCRYGVDGVMIGRAALSRPWLFRQVRAALAGQPVPPDPTLAEQRQLLLDHYRLVVEQFGPEKGTILMRRYACRYAHGSSGARTFRSHVSGVSTPEEFAEVVDRFFPPDTTV